MKSGQLDQECASAARREFTTCQTMGVKIPLSVSKRIPEDRTERCQPSGRRTVVRKMETRLTRKPGEPGTKKLLARFGERLVRVRYLYDAAGGRRLKTVELVVETVPWKPRARSPRRRDEDIVAVRIHYQETDLRERAKRLGAVWRPAQKIWEITWGEARRLGIADRVVTG
jgi:hypothetical protein